MSHFRVCVAIPVKDWEHKEAEEIKDAIEETMAKFDINADVPEYKYYVKKEDIERMAETYKINPANLKEIASHMPEWNGNEGGFDDKGLYAISTSNPNGHIDSCETTDCVQPDDIFKDNFIPHAIITPKGDWVQAEEFFYSVGESNQETFNAWEIKFKERMLEYKKEHCLIALVDCHI